MKWHRNLLGVLAALTASTLGAHASIFTLTHLNSVFSIDSAAGAYEWLVDGRSQLTEQAFWVGVGSTSPEERLGNYFTQGWAGPDGRSAYLEFTHSLFKTEIIYVLTGGAAGSGTSDVTEVIRLTNTSAANLPLRFFQYCDFDLNGTPGDDRLWFANENSARQVDLGSGYSLSETVVTPAPSHHEGDVFPNTKNRLDDGLPTVLNDLPALGAPLTGNVTWAFEWDRPILPSGSFLISKIKHLDQVPEPGVLLLLGVGLFGIEFLRRRRMSG